MSLPQNKTWWNIGQLAICQSINLSQ